MLVYYMKHMHFIFIYIIFRKHSLHFIYNSAICDIFTILVHTGETQSILTFSFQLQLNTLVTHFSNEKKYAANIDGG